MNAPLHHPVIPAADARQETAPPRGLWWTKVDWTDIDAGMRKAIAGLGLKPGIVSEFRQPDRSSFDAWR